ncbi:unnamed protein product, partial [Hapterophycus canaliculatus]
LSAAVIIGVLADVASPITRSLIGNGIYKKASSAFLISGGVVSIWYAMAIVPMLKLKPFLLPTALEPLAAGYAYEWVV